jgi:hypothetical protein
VSLESRAGTLNLRLRHTGDLLGDAVCLLLVFIARFIDCHFSLDALRSEDAHLGKIVTDAYGRSVVAGLRTFRLCVIH